jgi:uncharacterized protein
MWSTTRPSWNHVLDSAVFGTGWALSGTCPGPALAQLGSGHLAVIFTVIGILGGVVLRGVVARRTQATSPAPITSVAGL